MPSSDNRHLPVRPEPSRAAWLGPLVVTGAFVWMLGWSWRTWPDVLVDFGRELYIAWQLSAGKALYTDIAYFNGPLSPYLNAFLFRAFGVSLQTLALCNIVIAFVLVLLMYRLLAQVSSSFAAAVASLVFVAVFGFGQLTKTGNYNFVCPYSHELTHGIVLSVIALNCLARYQRLRTSGPIAGAGIALGLAFLTKPEVFLGAALAFAVGLGSTLWAEHAGWRRILGVLGPFLGALAIPPLLALALLSQAMARAYALKGVLGAWPWVLSGDVTATYFYRTTMGTLHPAASLLIMAKSAVVYALAFLPVAALGLLARRPGMRRIRLLVTPALALVPVLVAWQLPLTAWFDVARPFPVALAVLGLATFAGFVTRRAEQPAASHLALRLAVIMFGAGLLGKMLLNTHVYHYGFALAMPAALVLVVALVDWAPRFVERRGGDGTMLRISALAFVVVFTLVHLRGTQFRFARKTTLVGSGTDAFLADERGTIVNRALAEIARRVPPDATMTPMPEGVMLNFLSRRIDPIPYMDFMPAMVAMFGEEQMRTSFAAHPPDYIALVHRDTTEYGMGQFGHGYARQLYAWVRRNYEPLVLVGARPFRDERFGILLLRRRGLGRPVSSARLGARLAARRSDPRATTRATSGPILGGEACRSGVTPCASSTSEQVGPADATSAPLRPGRRAAGSGVTGKRCSHADAHGCRV